ncbi:PTIP binding protein Pa1 [Lycorma delicatula]|uniref:PTIP binding protein Pa1 n=1 Tax=Lycorma delicatula TaxID=130591 RepID=UPI003F50D616
MDQENSAGKTDEEFEIGCSDDEKYDIKLRDNGEWEPEPSVIADLYFQLESDGYIELEWQCPGRRPPTPQSLNDSKDNSNDKIHDVKEEEDKSDFEFKDEMSQLRLSVRPAENVGPRGSAKKKTTSLDAILSNMARHRKLDMMEQD